MGDWASPAEGAAWRGQVAVRGKMKPIEARIARFDAPETCVVESRVGGMDCHYELALIALTPEVTRVAAVLDLSAKTLPARLRCRR